MRPGQRRRGRCTRHILDKALAGESPSRDIAEEDLIRCHRREWFLARWRKDAPRSSAEAERISGPLTKPPMRRRKGVDRSYNASAARIRMRPAAATRKAASLPDPTTAPQTYKDREDHDCCGAECRRWRNRHERHR